MDLNLTTENIGFPSSTADMAFSGVGAPEISLEFFRFFLLTVKRGENPHLIYLYLAQTWPTIVCFTFSLISRFGSES